MSRAMRVFFVGTVLSLTLLAAALSRPAVVQAQSTCSGFHGATIGKDCGVLCPGKQARCEMTVSNIDECNDSLRIDSFCDTVHFPPPTGDVITCAPGAPFTLAPPGNPGDSQTFIDTFFVPASVNTVEDEARARGVDLGDGATGTPVPNPSVVDVSFPGVSQRVECCEDADCKDTLDCNTDTCDVVNHVCQHTGPTACPDVKVQLSTSTPVISALDTASYDILVTANGPGQSENVQLTDQLPGGLNWALSGANAGACSINAAKLLTCGFGNLDQGATRSLTVSAATTGNSCPLLEDTAMVSALVDTNAGNNTAGPVGITVNCPDAGVQLVTSTPTISAGDTASYTIDVTANGPGTSRNVLVTDQLPGGLNWALSGPSALACSINAANLLTCNFGDLPSGATRQVTVSAATNANSCPALQDSVSLTATVDTIMGNNAAGPVGITVNCPDAGVQVITPTPNIAGGDQAIYVIDVTANGPGTSKNVMVSNPLPPGLAWTVGGASAGACAVNANVLKCNFGDLPQGQTRQVTLTATTGATNCGTIQDTATLTATVDTMSPNNVSGPVSIAVSCPDVDVMLTTSTPSINAGDTAVYDVKVTANGPGPSNGVNLMDVLPAGLTWTVTGPDAAACSIDAGGMLVCDFGSLPQGAMANVTLSAETSTANCGTINNTANVKATIDTNVGNNVSGPVAITIACSGGCRITGGGFINGITDPGTVADIGSAHFGGQVGAPCGCIGCFDEFGHIQGNWQHDRKAHNGTLHAKSYNSLVCALDQGAGPDHPIVNANKACFSGVADYTPTNGKKTTLVAFRVEVEDRGEPGSSDRYRMRVWIPISTSGETPDDLARQACCTNAAPQGRTPDLDDNDRLTGGNIQIHPALRKSIEGQCPVPRGACFPTP